MTYLRMVAPANDDDDALELLAQKADRLAEAHRTWKAWEAKYHKERKSLITAARALDVDTIEGEYALVFVGNEHRKQLDTKKLERLFPDAVASCRKSVERVVVRIVQKNAERRGRG